MEKKEKKETKSTTPCPHTVTVRRNPPRKARATPSTIPLPMHLPSSSPSSIPHEIPSFPIDDILSIEIPQDPKPDLASQPLSEKNLKVFLRIRPLLATPQGSKNGAQPSRSKNAWPQNPSSKNAPKTKPRKKSEICLRVNDSHSVTLCPPQSLQDQKRIKSEVYEGFSHVFSADSSQEEVYEKMVNPLVEDFMRGKSGMLAALGPSGSGKTHTVFGCPRQPGMVPFALRQIFAKPDDSGTHPSRTFYLSMFEIHSERGKAERIFDLSQDGIDASIHQSTIKGLKEAIVCDAQQAESLIAHGMTKRATAMTNSNNQSSRSQCIINIRSGPIIKIDGEVDAQSNSALLTIVDLAGAEREKRTGNQGARLLESNFINNTSMVFGLCLRSLLEHQKNPKKPMQKHFQSSLLTKYLRDYLEGKKRMTLILTVKSGEEDYLDASFLLRQASPYMKIKFDSVEEPFNLIGNKRNFQTLPRAEQLKRMKLISFEACAVDEGKGDGDYQLHKEEVPPEEIKEVKPTGVLVQRSRSINLEVNDDESLKENVTELAMDREYQIMRGFAKALLNVLKQYKKKLEVAENEIHCLRESLTSEKLCVAELENDLKSCCACGKEVSAEVPLIEVDKSRANKFAELEGYQSTDVYEVVKNETPCLRDGENSQSSDLENEVNDSTEVSLVEVDESRVNGFAELEGYQPTDVHQVNTGVSFSNLNGSECVDNAETCDSTVRSSGLVIASSLGVENFEEKNCQNGDHSPGNVDNAEDLKDIKDIGREDTRLNGETTGSGLLESVVCSSQSLVVSRDDSSSSIEGSQLPNEAEKKLLDGPLIPDEDVTSGQICNASNAPEIEPKLASSCKPLNPEKPKRRLLPASSILLKNISSLDFEDENEKPKGTRGDKNLAADVTKRTQGSISLLRLLTDNLHH